MLPQLHVAPSMASRTPPMPSADTITLPIRVLLIDEQTIVRAGIRSLLQMLKGVEVVGEATPGREAVMLAGALRPDIVVLDAGCHGPEISARLKRSDKAVRILLMPSENSELHQQRAMRAGCSGYLPKQAPVWEMESAIRALARGETYVSPAVAKCSSPVTTANTAADSLSVLTPRQCEVLQLVAQGYTSRNIGHRLKLSFKTVEAHRAHIMDRLAVRDLAGLVRYALRAGLVPPDA